MFLTSAPVLTAQLYYHPVKSFKSSRGGYKQILGQRQNAETSCKAEKIVTNATLLNT